MQDKLFVEFIRQGSAPKPPAASSAAIAPRQ
jgi:hypothetical protein